MQRHPSVKHTMIEPGKPLPLTPIVLLVFTLFSFLLTRFGIDDAESSIVFVILSGLLVFVTTLVHIQVGLGIMICAAALSPKVVVAGLPFTLEDFIIPVVFFAWITRVMERKEELQPTNLKAPIISYILITGMSTLIAATSRQYFSYTQSATFYFKYIEYFIIFVVTLNNINSLREAKAFIYTLLMVSGLMAMISIFYFESRGQDTSRMIGPQGTEPNVLGAYYCFMVMLLVSTSAWVRSLLLRIVFGCIILLIMHPVIYSLSRTTWISMSVGLIIIGLYFDKRVVIVTIIGLIILANTVPDFVKQRAKSIPDTVTGKTESSWVARQLAWKNLVPVIMKNPLFGNGKGTIDLARADNEYVLQLAEGGVLGLGCMLWILWRILQKSQSLIRRGKDPLIQGFCMGVFAGTLALMVHSLAATTFTVVRVMVIFYFAVGVVYAVANILENEELKRDRFSRGYIDLSGRNEQRPNSLRVR